MTASSPTVTIRKATAADADIVLDLINDLAREQIMLPRSPASVIEHIRDFTIAEVDGTFAGCGALQVVWSDIAEVRSLAVHPQHQHQGLGKKIVERLLDEALELGLARVFAFTYVPGFFEKLQFAVVEHARLPHKVFNDCLNCPKFHRCDEIAVLRVLREDAPLPARGPLAVPLDTLPVPARRGR